MTDNTQYRPLNAGDWEWWAYGVRDGCAWVTQKFASWFTTAWLYLILWAVVGGAFAVLLYIDGKFSRGLAEGVEDIDPLSFQAMGWVYRFFAAAFLMAAARCIHKGIKGAATFRVLGAFASFIVCLHAFGFGFEALDHRRDQAVAAQQVALIAETNNTEVIDQLKEQKSQITTDTADAVEILNAEIKQYITDGLNNDELADDSRARRNDLQDSARAQKAEIDREILRLTLAGADTRTEAVAVNAEAEPWAPLFVAMGQLASWSKEPSDWTIYLCAVGFVVLWVLLGECLVIFIPERIYMMHLRDAELSRRSAAAIKGHETRKKAVDPDHSIVPMVKDEGYWEERIRKALNTRLKAPTAEGMWNSYFPGLASVHELRGHLHLRVKRGLLSQEDFDFIMREGEYAPEEQMTNGHDKSKGDSDEDDTGTDQLPAPY